MFKTHSALERLDDAAVCRFLASFLLLAGSWPALSLSLLALPTSSSSSYFLPNPHLALALSCHYEFVRTRLVLSSKYPSSHALPATRDCHSNHQPNHYALSHLAVSRNSWPRNVYFPSCETNTCLVQPMCSNTYTYRLHRLATEHSQASLFLRLVRLHQPCQGYIAAEGGNPRRHDTSLDLGRAIS